MAKMTKEQIFNINHLCRNGWRFGLQYYVYHKEKCLVKSINLDEANYLEFSLKYNSENQIQLHISKFYQEKGQSYAISHGLGKDRVLDETKFKRKNINALINFTKTLTDEKLMIINDNTLSNDVLLKHYD